MLLQNQLRRVTAGLRVADVGCVSALILIHRVALTVGGRGRILTTSFVPLIVLLNREVDLGQNARIRLDAFIRADEIE